MTGCGVQRKAVTHEVTSRTEEVVRDTVREQVIVAVYDTLREVTTITVQQNELGDTVKTSIVTERDRFRDRAAVKDREEKVMVKTDTVYVERRDSVFVEKPMAQVGSGGGNPVVKSLKWIFWILVMVIVLLVLIKVSRVFRV